MICTIAFALCAVDASGQPLSPFRNADGLKIVVADQNAPTLRVILPGSADSDKSIEVIFPEHVTARLHGSNEAEHLYMFTSPDARPSWHQSRSSVEYEMDVKSGIHFLARGVLQEDGVLFHYEFTNRSQKAYDMIYAVTDPRLTGIFHDVRLERTYVHHKNGFELLGSETPKRVTMPLDQWLPSRYLDSYTWPVPNQRVERRDDGITYYNKSEPVDEPMVATLSTDRKWVVASFSRTTGNVWSNPELTCQHVDPVTPLPAGGKATLEVKLLVFSGTIEDALSKERSQRQSLQ
ncbi:MAG TPA: hypothetical protein VMP68_03275 [Candidatus Eisenbacteria bacterium]|nr:hypothetical protein [Candidatus Eisenbacteria bacterium]